jgi:hypothetical protein
MVTGVTDQFGFTGSEQGLRVSAFFPLELVRCVATTQDVIRVFNSSTATKMSGSGAAVPIGSMLCGR